MQCLSKMREHVNDDKVDVRVKEQATFWLRMQQLLGKDAKMFTDRQYQVDIYSFIANKLLASTNLAKNSPAKAHQVLRVAIEKRLMA